MKYLVDNDVFFSAIYEPAQHHARSRAWLDRAKPSGWGIAIETYLAAVRLLMNRGITGTNAHTALDAILAVETELHGNSPHPGRVIHSNANPDPTILGHATGHKQVMDFWLMQLAKQERCKLATFDTGTLANWPANTIAIPPS